MAAKRGFVHLHTHTDYSMLDGAAKVADIAKTVAADGAPAFGITDHGTMGGVIQAFEQAKKQGIRAIPGFEAYHVPDFESSVERAKSRRSKKSSDDEGAAADGKLRNHLILLAHNDAGYKNLLYLSSKAWLEQYYMKPLVDDNLLDGHTEGLIATSTCLGSVYNQHLLDFVNGRDDNGEKKAIEALMRHRDLFGKDNYFIEVQDHSIPDQDSITPYHLKHSKDLGIPLLATNDIHYISAADAEMHDCLLCIQTTSKKDDPDRFRFSSDENYVRTAEEMYRLFPEEQFPGACTNTLLVAEMAQDISNPTESGLYLIPEFPDTPEHLTAQEFLREKVYAGAERKYSEGGRIPNKVRDKIEFELDVIHNMGFDNYFLIVADLVQEEKALGGMVGPGRGSAAGSIVSYCTDITTVDPVRYGLFFERFLNPGRKSMPDIDIDFEPDRRDGVRRRTAEKYGHDRVSYIGTYGELKGKSAIKHSAKLLGKPHTWANQLTAAFPQKVDQKEVTLNENMADKAPEGFEQPWDTGAELRARYASEEEVREVIDVAKSVEGYYQTRGVHAAGVLITPTPLWNHVPVRRKDTKGEDLPASEYDKDDAEAIGGLKMDILGLINLSIIKRALELIRRETGQSIDIDAIPLDDKKVYDMLAEGRTAGIFQLAGAGITKLVQQVMPENVEDISAILALYRPGPMGSNMHTDFAKRKNGKAPVEAPHEDFKTLFAETHALVVYQEFMLVLVQHYAGFTPAEADDVRKATGKKDMKKMASLEPKFKEGMIGRGYSKKLADTLWDLLPPFAAYSFNKAHSLAYAMVSYQTGWLKANYPAQYAAACIDLMGDDQVPIQAQEAREQGIRVFAPDINKSDIMATTEHGQIWLGMGRIKGCGENSLRKLIEVRNDGGNFKTLADFMVRVSGKGVNANNVRGLIHAGCFDKLHTSRKVMIDKIEEISEAAKKVASASSIDFGDDDLFGGITDTMENAAESISLVGEDYSISERMEAEIQTLGFAAGTHPFALIERSIDSAKERKIIPPEAVPVGDPSIREGAKVCVYGTIASFKEGTTKTGKEKTDLVIETGQGPRVKSMVIGRKLANLRVGALAVVTGSYQIEIDDRADEEEGEEKTGTAMIMANEAKVYSLDYILGKEGASHVEQADEVPAQRQSSERNSFRGGDAPRKDKPSYSGPRGGSAGGTSDRSGGSSRTALKEREEVKVEREPRAQHRFEIILPGLEEIRRLKSAMSGLAEGQDTLVATCAGVSVRADGIELDAEIVQLLAVRSGGRVA